MSRLSLLALGVGAYLAFALTSFPAAVAARWFKPDALQLALLDGTVWHGNAGFGSVNGFAFSDLRWQLHPAALVTGKISASVEARLADGLASSDVAVAGERIALTNVAASTRLEPLGDLFRLGMIAGAASARLDELELVRGVPVAASGTIRIADLAAEPLVPIPGVTLIQLGDYQARLTTEGDTGIVAVITDEGGPLELEGQVVIAPDRTWRLQARIKPRAGAPQLLTDALAFLPENANGFREFIDQGTF